jgi:hypothetical protein
VMETGEDVEFFSVGSGVLNLVHAALLDGWAGNGHGAKDTAVEHVEQVHDDEAMEHEGLVLHAPAGDTIASSERTSEEFVFNSGGSRASVHKDDHSDELVESLRKDVSHHQLGNDLLVLLDAFLSDLSRVGVLSGEGNSGEHIHDQVDPEELHHVEGGVTNDESS